MVLAALKAQQDGNPIRAIRGDMDVMRDLLNEAGVTSKTKQAQFFSVLQGSMDAQRPDDWREAPAARRCEEARQ